MVSAWAFGATLLWLWAYYELTTVDEVRVTILATMLAGAMLCALLEGVVWLARTALNEFVESEEAAAEWRRISNQHWPPIERT